MLHAHMPMQHPSQSSDRNWDAEEIAILEELLFTPSSHSDEQFASVSDVSVQLPTPTGYYTDGNVSMPRRWSNQSTGTADLQSRAASPASTSAPTTPETSQFKPLTSTQCLHRIHKTYELVNKVRQRKTPIQLSQGSSALQPQLSQLGWNLFSSTPTLTASVPSCLLLEKKFQNHSVQDLMHRTWQHLADSRGQEKLLMGKRVDLEILQRFNGDGLILRRDIMDVSASSAGVERSIYMLFRIETKQGFTICAHSLDDATLQARFQSATSLPLTTMFHWITFYQLDNDSGIQVEVGFTPKRSRNQPPASMNSEQAIQSTLMSLSLWEQTILSPVSPTRKHPHADIHNSVV